MKTNTFGRRIVLALAVTLSAILAPTSVSANNDPHRTFLPAVPFDLPAVFCGFTVHLAAPVDREYGKISTGPDGSTTITFTGSLFTTLTNEVTGKAITLNTSGPATVTIFPDGRDIDHGEGLALIFAANGPQVGLPSGLVLLSGPVDFIGNLVNGTISSFLTPPHVLLDVCAALA